MSVKKHSLYLGLSNGLNLALNFFGGIFLTRLLGPEGRGVLSKLQAGAGLLAQITTFKAHMGFIYFVANNKIDKRKLMGISIWIVVGSFLLSSLILLGVITFGYGDLILPIGKANFVFALYALVLFILSEAQIIYSAFLRGSKNFKDIYVNQIGVATIRLVLFASVYYAVGQSTIPVEHGIHLQIALVFVSLLATVYFLRRSLGLRAHLIVDFSRDLKPFFSFVSISYLSLLANFLMKSINIWLVEYFKGSTDLGYYAVGVNLSALLLILPSTIREVFIPYIASSDKEENLKNLKFFTRVCFSSVATVSLFIILIADQIIPFLYGSEFQLSILPFKYLLAANAAASIGIIFSAYNYGSGSPLLNFLANLLCLLIIVCIGIWLIPKFGIEGAAIAALITYLCNSFFLVLIVMVKNRLPIANYFFLTRSDLKELRKFINEKRKG